jgi:TadE-like protein
VVRPTTCPSGASHRSGGSRPSGASHRTGSRGRSGHGRADDRDGGQASVELALALPLVVVLLMVVVQVGVVVRAQVLVTHAAREGARAAAVDTDPAAARRAVEASSALDADRLSVVVANRDGPGSRVRVEVGYRLATDLPLVGSLLPDITLAAVTTMRVER